MYYPATICLSLNNTDTIYKHNIGVSFNYMTRTNPSIFEVSSTNLETTYRCILNTGVSSKEIVYSNCAVYRMMTNC